MLHLKSIIKDITNSIFNACIIITREAIHFLEVSHHIVSESRRIYYPKYTNNELILYFVLCFVLSALYIIDWLHDGYIYVIALLTTFVFKDLLASTSLMLVLCKVILFSRFVIS